MNIQTGNFINGIDEFDPKWAHNKYPFAQRIAPNLDSSTSVKDNGPTTENSAYQRVEAILALWQ